MNDLVCLVPDRNMEAAVRGILGRPDALGIRSLDHEIIVHPNRDPGCFHQPNQLLSGFHAATAHAVVLLDLAWDGAPAPTAHELRQLLATNLATAGLSPWAEAVVIDPELEAWVFSDSPHVASVLGWAERVPGIRDSLEEQGLWRVQEAKPADPKAALEWLLREVRKPRSSAIYRLLAERVSFNRCRDESFQQFRELLRRWFPRSTDVRAARRLSRRSTT